MKHKVLKKKMSINKITISDLDANQEKVVMGGVTGSCGVISVCIRCQITDYTCNTCYTHCNCTVGSTCPC